MQSFFLPVCWKTNIGYGDVGYCNGGIKRNKTIKCLISNTGSNDDGITNKDNNVTSKYILNIKYF